MGTNFDGANTPTKSSDEWKMRVEFYVDLPPDRDPALLERLERYGFRVATMVRHPLDVMISILHFALVDGGILASY